MTQSHLYSDTDIALDELRASREMDALDILDEMRRGIPQDPRAASEKRRSRPGKTLPNRWSERKSQKATATT